MTSQPDNLPRPGSTSARRRPTQALRPEPEHTIVNKPEPDPNGPVLAPWEEAPASTSGRMTKRVNKADENKSTQNFGKAPMSDKAQGKSTQSFGKMPTREVPKPGTKPITKPIPQSPPRPLEQLEPQIRQAIADFKAGMSSYDVRQKLLYGGVAETQVLEVIGIARERAGMAPPTGNTQYLQKPGPVPFNSAATPTAAPASEPAPAAPQPPANPWLAVSIGGVIAVLGLVCLALVLKASSDPGASLNLGLLALAALLMIIGGGIIFTALQSREKS
ncbi:MAG: hypothetical protein IT462_09795 [Planctomycetes bacterium]|nr:hypothetical protein [Planctomycetota bacterium]